jgi:uroporphyrinogen decarboxylase
MHKKLVIRAAGLEKVERTPIWMMRQAGRYLPEYNETKERAGGFLKLCKSPEYGVEAALQPVRRFGFDAAILFSDILIPAEAMGIKLDFNPGPIIANPVRNRDDVAALRVPEPEESLDFALEMLRMLRARLDVEKTLIGFAGAPFTVASYLVEGGSPSKGFEAVRRLMYAEPDLLGALMAKIVATTIEYLRAQIKAGADMVQLFDSSAGHLPPDIYKKLAIEASKKVIEGIRDAGAPIIYFAPGAMTSVTAMKELGAHVIGVDHRIGLGEARNLLGSDTAVQGNLDPAALLGAPESVRDRVRRVMEENAGRDGHIFNLGHGVLPETPVANVEAMVRAVRESA